MVTHCLRNPSFRVFNWVSNLIILVIVSYVFFFIISYVTNIIKTDQIVMKEQKVYRSLRQIVNELDEDGNKDLMLPFTAQAENVSLLKLHMDRPIINRLHHFITHGHGQAVDGILGFIEAFSKSYNLVVIESVVALKLIKFFCCQAAEINEGKGNEFPDTCILMMEEMEEFPSESLGFMVKTMFSTTRLYQRFEARSRVKFEAGFNFDILFNTLQLEHFSSSINRLDCLSESKNTKMYDPDFEAMAIKYFMSCIYILSSILFVAFIVLVHECSNQQVKMMVASDASINSLQVKSCKIITTPKGGHLKTRNFNH